MAVKVITCPSCGEEIELTDLYEGVEIRCKFCECIMIYQEGKLLLLDTNEEFDIEDLEIHDEEIEDEEEMEEEDYYYYEEEEY
uniref:Lysine biosynthesis protein LysW n=1 Tax=Archaeoglobus fulgidus TaxID=2234 RepID=A0A7J2TIA5_ARCFL